MIKINNNNNHRFKKLYANKYIENKLKKKKKGGGCKRYRSISYVWFNRKLKNETEQLRLIIAIFLQKNIQIFS